MKEAEIFLGYAKEIKERREGLLEEEKFKKLNQIQNIE